MVGNFELNGWMLKRGKNLVKMGKLLKKVVGFELKADSFLLHVSIQSLIISQNSLIAFV